MLFVAVGCLLYLNCQDIQVWDICVCTCGLYSSSIDPIFGNTLYKKPNCLRYGPDTPPILPSGTAAQRPPDLVPHKYLVPQ